MPGLRIKKMNEVPLSVRLDFAYQMVDTIRDAIGRIEDRDHIEVTINSGLTLSYTLRQLRSELAWWVSQIERHLAAKA